MKNAIGNGSRGNARLMLGVWRMSRAGAGSRFWLGMLELVPQFLFYTAQAIITFTMFSVIQTEVISKVDLVAFLLIMIFIDSFGDALIFKGIHEYCASLRRGQAMYYLLTPGMPFLKVIFLRWDLPMMYFGLASGVAAVLLSFFHYGTHPLLLVFALLVGTAAHCILTSGFHIIQAYFDPTMPIPFGSPATRLYTKPMHLIVSGGISLGVMMSIYPAYFITAFPSGLAIGRLAGELTQHVALCYLIGMICLGLWVFFLNGIVKKSCRERQN